MSIYKLSCMHISNTYIYIYITDKPLHVLLTINRYTLIIMPNHTLL